jgi:hypothetical protein
MAVIETGQRSLRPVVRPTPERVPAARVIYQRGPGPVRPGSIAVRYRGTGVAMSCAPHRRRPVSAAVTVAVAGMAALITVWLGVIAESGGVAGSPAAVPERLSVVRVEPGENLQHLAARVAPDAPVGRVVARIRELNHLESGAVDAGQTLIAPVE